MGSLQRYPTGTYHACFRLAGRRFKRSLHTNEEREATSLLGRIEENVRLVERGKLAIPEGADIPTFLLSDGQLQKPVSLPERFLDNRKKNGSISSAECQALLGIDASGPGICSRSRRPRPTRGRSSPAR